VKERGRTLDSIIAQYYDSVRPMHRQYLEPTSQFADLMVGEETDAAADVVASHIKAVLNSE
jgi:uridine kinase